MVDDRRFSSAIEKATQDLRARDSQAIVVNSGGVVQDNALHLRILNRTAVVGLEDWTVRWVDGGEPDVDMKVVLLHYLLGSLGRLKNSWITFREVEGGSLYFSAYNQAALIPLVKAFESDPEGFARNAESLGGRKVQRGDLSYDLYVFPFLVVNVTVWKGDDEVPTSGNILFDSSASNTLRAEDLAHLAMDLVRILKRGKL
jgi:hypothetical protein